MKILREHNGHVIAEVYIPQFGEPQQCPLCKGKGQIPAEHDWSGPPDEGEMKSCHLCQGSGKIRDRSPDKVVRVRLPIEY